MFHRFKRIHEMRIATSVLLIAASACAVLAALEQCPKDAKCCPLETGGCSIDSPYCILDSLDRGCSSLDGSFSLENNSMAKSKMLVSLLVLL